MAYFPITPLLRCNHGIRSACASTVGDLESLTFLKVVGRVVARVDDYASMVAALRTNPVHDFLGYKLCFFLHDGKGVFTLIRRLMFHDRDVGAQAHIS